MNEWKNIKIEKPKENQPVYYYFDVFDKVYEGFFCTEDNSELFDEPLGTYVSNIFYSKHGWLADDITWWMPREENSVKPIFNKTKEFL